MAMDGREGGRFILVPDDANLTCFDVSNGKIWATLTGSTGYY